MPKSPSALALKLRGGMDLGPLSSELAGQISRTAAAVTVGSAVLDKYVGLEAGTLSEVCSGELFNTNALVAIASGALTVVTHSISSGFGTNKLVAALWIVNLLSILHKSGISADTIMANKEAAVVAAVLGVMAFVE